MTTASYKDLFNGNIRVSLKTAVSVLASYPASASTFARLGGEMKQAERRRAAEAVDVPPLMIVSTTDECNLSCKYCYACERGKAAGAELADGRVSELLTEASKLGVSIILLAGGEPLLSHGWMDAMAQHPEMAGLVFTNGTLLDADRRAWFEKHRHIFPVLSLEGGEAQTDSRRGDGVYAQVAAAMSMLRSAEVPFGVSVTVTRENIEDILTGSFVTEYISKGCRLFVFVEYVPVTAGTDSLMLTKADKIRLTNFTFNAGRRHSALFIAFPGDETQYGGCLAAGRGFLNISASGDVEPCPFAPFSDVNLKDMTLKDALKSDLLRKVRENHNKLTESGGGCALWHNQTWLQALAKEA